ncbi:DNA cross-link repair protein [Achlya hypogyna]|uniref:DNA cross-link repair protein n=1 Tax=Achlya hypogyna TaxID=1202772 RepID=A0A1V9YAE2_ACHHY|nr:DNA cross-link repair protein [Achlya hypogyna]
MAEPIVSEMDSDAASDTTIRLDDDECPPTQCLAAETTPAAHAVDVPPAPATVSCPSCGKNLTYFNEEAQLQHVNACLDALQQFERNKRDADLQTALAESLGTAPEPPAAETCIVCGLSFAGKSAAQRIHHTKQCAKKYGVSLQALLQADVVVDQEYLEAASTAQPNAFDILMRPKAAPTPSAPGNAFDLLMRGAQTSAIVSKKAAIKSAAAKRRGPWNKPARHACPEYKKIKGTSIIVDGFSYASSTLSTTYVLSHFHSDHYGGLSRNFSAGIIYCTPTTARLVQLCLGVDKKYLHPLPLHQPLTLPAHKAQMTFIDANHCPGAALILFQFQSGKAVLHTGDFRYDPSMLLNRFLAPFATPGQRLDAVYLDTTYCDTQHCHPTQAVAITEAKRLVDLHRNDRALFLVGSYSIGKERLFMDVAAHLECKVYVERSKLSLLSCFEWPSTELGRLTTESAVTDLHVVPMNHLNFDGMRALLTKHRLRYRKVIALQPTGWTFSRKKGPSVSSKRSQLNDALVIYGIPYSEHSSFDELCAFTKAFDPKEIIPTVNCSKAAEQVALLRQTCFNNLTHHFAPKP